jgi:hypothetical protein
VIVVLAVAACALAGCGQTTSQQVQAKVQQFATAVKDHDAKTLCDQVLAPNLLAHFGVGLRCTQAMKIFVGSVRDPNLAVGRVVVQDGGRRAEAITLSTAKHQIGSLSAVELVNTSGGWRVSGLGSPLVPGLKKKAS